MKNIIIFVLLVGYFACKEDDPYAYGKKGTIIATTGISAYAYEAVR